MNPFDGTIRVGDANFTFRRLNEEDYWEIDRRVQTITMQRSKQNPAGFGTAAGVTRMRVTLDVASTAPHDWSKEPTDLIAAVYEEYQSWLDSFRSTVRRPVGPAGEGEATEA